jgi:hypothetical protein
MKDHLIFDTTDVVTVQDTDSVGAYVRSDKSGALITHHALQKPSSGSFVFVDADVTPASDSIAEASHGFQTGDKVQLTSSGVLPAGLALLTDYYVIRVDANNIKLASSQYNAEWNIPVDITAAAGGGNHTVTGVEVEARALDVWIANPSIAISDGGGSITVDAVNLDIRDLVFATDKVDVSGSSVSITGDVNVTQGTSPWVIGDGGGSITVDAVDLDIRNLDYSQDNVAIKGATGNELVVNADGSINVNADISVVNGSDKAEDSASASGDIGTYVLAVRQDTLASSTSADGDYASFKVSAAGALYVNIAESSGTISVSDAALANSAIANAANPLNTANTAEAAVSSALANRKYLWIYNNDNTKVFVGAASVTAANGFPISPGSYMELRAGAAVSPFFVGQTGKTPEIRTLELS